MAGKYIPAEIEPRWQKYWEENRTFRAPGPADAGFDPHKPKYYVLDMFPYPSGAGLHVGHPEGYTATDILARYKRMRGFNVLHPMGWDAFGLPAEQYAIRTGTHPAVTTRCNIETFRRQIKALGFSYDWDREVDTTDPGYYKWTQWIFTLLYDTWYDELESRGRPISELPVPEGLDAAARRRYVDSRRLAYLDEIAVWWCPGLGTVLANEEVINGRSERGDYPCERRPLSQWMLRITAYAQRLLDDLERLDWPGETKKQQQEWVGRSEGADVWFGLEARNLDAVVDAERVRKTPDGYELKIFTTRPDTLFGATYMVLAPEHPLVDKLATEEQRAAVVTYRRQAATRSDLDRTAHSREKTGVFTGAHAVNPVNGERIPIWIADYVLYSYGTGAIMAVPGGDERDFDFAMAFDLPIVAVVEPLEPLDGRSAEEKEKAGLVRAAERKGQKLTCFVGEGRAVCSPWIDGLRTPEAIRTITGMLEQKGAGRHRVTYRLRDWIFSRQRYWGEPFPILHFEDGGTAALPEAELPLRLPELEDYAPTGRPEPLLSKATDWIETRDPSTGAPARRETNTMPNWAGSCWYYLRYLDPRNDREPWDIESERYWMPVDLYVGGREHAVLHLLYARFWHKVLFDRGYVSTTEPFQRLFHQGLILAFAYQTQDGRKVPTSEVEEPAPGTYAHRTTGEPLVQIVAKMSKALGNVENPDDIVAQYGADAFRCYEMFMGPLEDSKPWDTRAVDGILRFLQRCYRLVTDDGQLRSNLSVESAPDEELERALHRCVKKVADDIERLAFNTAIAAMMVFVNEATPRVERLSRSQAERFVLVLSPFAPHLGEELWQILGHAPSLAHGPWPEVDPALLVDRTIEVPVQVDGKLRARITVPAEITEDELKAEARRAVAGDLDGKTVRKVVVVPKRLVNFVTR